MIIGVVYFIGINIHRYKLSRFREFFGVRKGLDLRNSIFSTTCESLHPRNKIELSQKYRSPINGVKVKKFHQNFLRSREFIPAKFLKCAIREYLYQRSRNFFLAKVYTSKVYRQIQLSLLMSPQYPTKKLLFSKFREKCKFSYIPIF